MEETMQKIVTENPDSIEIGTPSKGGVIKVYGNFSEKEVFKSKIDNALELRSYAVSKMGELR
jgi:hypothetical protein